jgi:hypothetical protein
MPSLPREIAPKAFRQIYAEALAYGFATLGKHLSNVVTDYLSRKYRINPVDTYENPKALSQALEKTLGYGSVMVESRIVKSLYSQLSLPQEGIPRIRMSHPEDFERYIVQLRAAEEARPS